MLTIDPDPCSSIGPSAARVARRVKKFICSAHSNSSSLVAKKPSTYDPQRPDVVDEHVDAAVRLDRLLDEQGRPVPGEQVHRNCGDPVESVKILGGERPCNYPGAFGDQRLSDGEPDALVAPVTTAILSVS